MRVREARECYVRMMSYAMMSDLLWFRCSFPTLELGGTYVHSYSFHRSTHSNGSGQMTFAQGLLDGQFRSRFRAIVAWPHWVPFIAGGRGKCLPSSLFDHKNKHITTVQ